MNDYELNLRRSVINGAIGYEFRFPKGFETGSLYVKPRKVARMILERVQERRAKEITLRSDQPIRPIEALEPSELEQIAKALRTLDEGLIIN